MLGKIAGAFLGSKLSKKTSEIDGPMGAVAGIVAATALKRLSLPAMIAITAGGWLAKKAFDENKTKPRATPTGTTTIKSPKVA